MLKVFQISLAVLLCLTGLVLALSEGGVVPAILGPVALASLYYVDWTRSVRLSQKWLTILAVVGFGAAGLELRYGDLDAPLVAAAHLLIYLSCVLLLSRKSDLVYWFLLALTVLQVSLAIFLSSRFWVGVGLITYMLLAIWTLSVFLIYRSLFSRITALMVPVESHTQALRLTRGITRQRGVSPLSWDFFRSTGTLTILTAFVGLALFLLIPRFWLNAAIPGDDDSGEPLTGFTRDVRLGDLGEILENPQPILSLQLFESASNRLLAAEGYSRILGEAPLFRGAVQSEYSGGYWQRNNTQVNEATALTQDPFGQVRQRYVLEDTRSNLLFVSGDVRSMLMEGPGSARRLQLSDEFVLRNASRQRIQYSAFSTLDSFDTSRRAARLEMLNPGTQPILTEGLDAMTRTSFPDRWKSYLETCVRVDSRLQRTATLAKSLTRTETNQRAAADLLLRHLQDDNRFRYSMKLTVIDPKIDPIEDFLFNRKEGHCEYFASALAIMLRGVNIPSRMVTGFKGGVYAADTNMFHVQQLHAHAWVEAYLDEQWVTLDPTPAARDVSVQQQQSVEAAQKYSGEQVWTTLVRFSRFDQQRLVYLPLLHLGETIWIFVKDLFEGKLDVVRHAWSILTTPSRWFSLDGLIVLCVATVLVFGSRWLWKTLARVPRMLSALIGTLESESAPEAIVVPYFERLLAIAAKHGLQRQPTQTAREFVQQLLTRWPPQSFQLEERSTPELSEAFNRVRFGHQPLTPQQDEQLAKWLTAFESSLSSPAGTTS